MSLIILSVVRISRPIKFRGRRSSKAETINRRFTLITNTNRQNETKRAIRILLMNASRTKFRNLRRNLRRQRLLQVLLIRLVIISSNGLRGLSLYVSLLIRQRVVHMMVSWPIKWRTSRRDALVRSLYH